MNDVWNLPTRQFLNDMLYLKMKRNVDDELERKALNKIRSYGKKF